MNITWTITKIDQNDTVADTRLYIGTYFTKSKLMYQGVVKLMKLSPAKIMFGNRIRTTFKEPNYILTISNLCYNDTIIFTLVVKQEIGTTLILRLVTTKSAKLIVEGTHFY